MERIERLLHELEYEVARGVMDGEIDDCLTWRKFCPPSKNLPDRNIIMEFRTRPMPLFIAAPEECDLGAQSGE